MGKLQYLYPLFISPAYSYIYHYCYGYVIGLVTNGKDGETEGVAEEGGLMEKIRADLLALAGTVLTSNIGCFWQKINLTVTLS